MVAKTAGRLAADGAEYVTLTDGLGNATSATQTPVHKGNSTGTGNTGISAAMAAVAGVTNYCTGFEVSLGGATTGSIIALTLTGALGGTLTWYLAVPAGILLLNTFVVEFTNPIPASAQNVALSLGIPALGIGNTNASVVIHGYTQ